MLSFYPNTTVAGYRYCMLWFVTYGESQGYANPLVSLAIGLIINAIHVHALFWIKNGCHKKTFCYNCMRLAFVRVNTKRQVAWFLRLLRLAACNTACTTACGDAPKEASSKRAIRQRSLHNLIIVMQQHAQTCAWAARNSVLYIFASYILP